MNQNIIPNRKDVPQNDKWNLSSLYENDEQWEKDLKQISSLTKKVLAFKGRLSESSAVFLDALKSLQDLSLKIETVYHYSSLLQSADANDATANDKYGRAMMEYTKMASEISFFNPEMQAIEESKLNEWKNLPEFADFKIYIEKSLYLKKYILSEKEERILNLQNQTAQTSYEAFEALTNVDMNKTFGSVKIGQKDLQLTQSTFSIFMENQDRKIREEAYKKFYAKFEENQHVIAALYAGSVNQDVFYAQAKGYPSSLEAALYSNKVPVSVYKNLIECVHKNLGTLHEYYALRKKVLGLDKLKHYDVYVPLVKSVETKTSYDEAVEICRNALSPLGKEYTDRLCEGLKNGWVDKYENVGKRSGAFSSGCYVGNPYILLNYKEDAIRDVFTMAHEGGHSMHSWYSVHNNPFMSYDYTIFEAEVASTFNEALVFEYLLKNAKTKEMKAYLLSMRASDILATLHRQTMFAEFELKTHEMVESGTPLTSEILRKTYRELLELYFGPDMEFEENSDLEGLRIPHFYTAFYVYKYATGISAALALAKKVLNGGEKEREDYFKFLKSGGSRYPIESLKVAGVNMESVESIQDACDEFKKIIDELKIIL